MDHDPEEDFLADCAGWLRGVALSYAHDSRYEDVRQEGQITLWRAYRKHADQPSDLRIAYAMREARSRMKDVAWRDARQTGQPSRIGRPEVAVVFSMDDLLEDGWESVLHAVDAPEGIEWAYHRGEILAALNALTPRQRRYVYARFWCGLDPSGGLHMNHGMREARTNNPDLRRDVLWTGNKTTVGAKQRLGEALAHLAV